MGKNVLIPLSLLERIVDLLVSLDLPEYHEFRREYGDILWALRIKKQKLELRDAYAKIIAAADKTERDEARIEYLRQKRCLHDDATPF